MVFFVSRPPLCFRYHLFVSNTISLFQIPSLCFNTLFLFQYHLFVSRATSLFQVPPLCFRYHLFVSNTTSLYQIPSLCFNNISLFQIPPLCFRYHLFDKKTLNAQEFKEAVEKITKLKISGSDSDTNSRNNHSWDSQNWPFGLEMAARIAFLNFVFVTTF